ncbi:hypothetical protein DFN05_001565 [Clostridium beijerinckii]|nr:hypothetical protein [Clostridium beijerinckii]NRZ03696.1 hypothetical protein [Clostridium beijerinckii]
MCDNDKFTFKVLGSYVQWLKAKMQKMNCNIYMADMK